MKKILIILLALVLITPSVKAEVPAPGVLSSATNSNGSANSSSNPQDLNCSGNYGPTITGYWYIDNITEVKIYISGTFFANAPQIINAYPMRIQPYMPNYSAGLYQMSLNVTSDGINWTSIAPINFYVTRSGSECGCPTRITGTLNGGLYPVTGSHNYSVIDYGEGFSGVYGGVDVNISLDVGVTNVLVLRGSPPDQVIDGHAWPSTYVSGFDVQSCASPGQQIIFTIPVITKPQLQL